MVMHFTARNILIVAALIGVIVLLLGSVSIVSWEYSNSDDFCSNACHEVHPQEPFAHQTSQHKNVACVECHIGRHGFFRSALEKSGHVTHAWSMLVGYDRPTHAISLKDASASCESCHPPTTHRNNSLREFKRYLQDSKNTEHHTTLIMRLVGRNFSSENRRGVNWHASGAVQYLADDPQALNIQFVQASLPDGSLRTYHDVRQFPDGPPAVQQGDLRTLDCLACHNRVGHPFPNPEDLVDKALAEGSLDRHQPYVKKYMMQLLAQDVKDEAHARKLVEEALQEYQQKFPETVPVTEDEERTLERYAENARRIAEFMVRGQHLEADDIDWRSFPDHNGHRDGPGCFRCHNGRLQTTAGVPIPVNCTTCHSIPLVTRRSGIPAYYLEMLDMDKPGDHEDPAFMAVHMDLAEDACSDCHGDIDFGDDDKSHCSNSGCHDANWQYLDFDALRMTTIGK